MEYVDGQTLREIVKTSGPDEPAAGHRGDGRRLRRARLQPQAQHHPPRREAGQHHDQPCRCGEGHGLRHRPRAGRGAERHPDRRGDRDGAVPVARAGAWGGRRRPQRRLRRRLRVVRAAHRRAAVHRRQPGRGGLPARAGGPAVPVGAQPAGHPAARRDRAQGAEQEPGQPLPVLRRDAGGSGAGAVGAAAARTGGDERGRAHGDAEPAYDGADPADQRRRCHPLCPGPPPPGPYDGYGDYDDDPDRRGAAGSRSASRPRWWSGCSP